MAELIKSFVQKDGRPCDIRKDESVSTPGMVDGKVAPTILFAAIRESSFCKLLREGLRMTNIAQVAWTVGDTLSPRMHISDRFTSTIHLN